MKKVLYLLGVALVSLFFVTTQVSAEEVNENEEGTDLILKEKGFSDKEINGLSDETKNEIVETDAERAEYEVEEVEQYYNSLDGQRYKITEENKDEIEEIRQQDLEELGLEESPTVEPFYFMNEARDGKWSAVTIVTKKGSTSKEHKYNIMTEWYWSKAPVALRTDSIGTAWEVDFSGVANTASKYAQGIGRFADGDRAIDTTKSVKMNEEVYGIKATHNLGNYRTQMGGFSQDVSVPKRLDGETSSMVTTYAHPYLPGEVSLNIGPGSISPENFVGDEWTYRVNITIGK